MVGLGWTDLGTVGLKGLKAGNLQAGFSTGQQPHSAVIASSGRAWVIFNMKRLVRKQSSGMQTAAAKVKTTRQAVSEKDLSEPLEVSGPYREDRHPDCDAAALGAEQQGSSAQLGSCEVQFLATATQVQILLSACRA